MKSANKSFSEIQGFSPIKLRETLTPSPSKNLTGSPRIARDLVADLFNNVQKWNGLHIKGCQLVKEIASLKNNNSGLSRDLEEKANELYSVVKEISLKKEFFSVLISQSQALADLGNTAEPLFLSLYPVDFARIVKEICSAYIKEFKMKELVLQNIALEKNKNNVMFLAACWTHQLDITEEINFKLESLLVETNHRPII